MQQSNHDWHFRVAILGSAGTGKTWSARQLVRTLTTMPEAEQHPLAAEPAVAEIAQNEPTHQLRASCSERAPASCQQLQWSSHCKLS